MKFSIMDFFSRCDQILRIWSHLLKKSLMEKLYFLRSGMCCRQKKISKVAVDILEKYLKYLQS